MATVYTPITLVATSATTGTQITTTKTNVTCSPLPIAGHTLILCCKNNSGFAVTSVTDTRGNAWNNANSSNEGAPEVEIWVCSVATTYQTGDVISYTLSGGTNASENVLVSEWSGIDISGYASGSSTPVDGTNSGFNTVNSTATGAQSIPGEVYNSLGIGVVGTGGANTQTFSTTSTGWNHMSNSTGPNTSVQMGVFYNIGVGPFSINMQWTATAINAWCLNSFYPSLQHNLSSLGVGW